MYLKDGHGVHKVIKVLLAVKSDPTVVYEVDDPLQVWEVYNWHNSEAVSLILALKHPLQLGGEAGQDYLVHRNQGHTILGQSGIAEEVS